MKKVTKRIDALTSEQEAAMHAYRAEMLALGRSTDKADRPRAEAAIVRMYSRLGRPAPLFLWFDGPATGSMARALLNGSKFARDNLGANLGANLWANLGDNLGANLGDNLGANLGDNLRDNLGDNLRDNLGDNLWDNLRDNLGDNLGDNLSWSFWGQHELGWIAHYLWPHQSLRQMHSENDFALLWCWFEIAASAGWWQPFENDVLICERPASLFIDDRGRLHCETGPALLCRDGFPIYAWHGARVPAHWIESRETLDATEVIKSTNVEQRAAGAAIVGWPKMLSVLQSRVIDDSGSDDIGQLIELTLPGLAEPGRFLKAKCPRNGLIVEGVPRTSDIDNLPIETALAAQAWRIGDPQSEYQHPARRT